jgi:hypothetical protein
MLRLVEAAKEDTSSPAPGLALEALADALEWGRQFGKDYGDTMTPNEAWRLWAGKDKWARAPAAPAQEPAAAERLLHDMAAYKTRLEGREAIYREVIKKLRARETKGLGREIDALLADLPDLAPAPGSAAPAAPVDLTCLTCKVSGLNMGDFTARGDHAGHDIGAPESHPLRQAMPASHCDFHDEAAPCNKCAALEAK